MALKEKISDKNRKLAIIIIAAIFALIIIYSISTIIYRANKTKVIIYIAPKSAKITLNGSHVSNDSTIWLEQGNYHLRAELNEHLSVYEKDITIGSETVEIYSLLNSLDDEGQKYIEEHNQEYTKAEGLIGYLDNKEGQALIDKNPILGHLPINNTFYSISYTMDDKNKPTVTIKAEPDFVGVAVKRLKNFSDVELSSVNIIFANESPLKNYYPNPLQNISEFIRAAFQLPDNTSISDAAEKDGYYYAKFSVQNPDEEIDDTYYYVVLKKNSYNEWEVLNTPQPILTIYNTNNIPKDVLNAINSY